MSSNVHSNIEQVTDEPMQMAEELAAVEELLQTAVVALYAPLTDLAHSQIKKASPYRCATVVLAAGVGSPDSELLRQQRLYLAAALEMLNIALAIHQLLLVGAGRDTDGEENPNQRSITGSVILTGDFCFTQSAILAAKTDNVRVVEIFSETLKTVSEKILRQLFTQRNGHDPMAIAKAEEGQGQGDTPPFHIELALCEAGVEGTAALLDSPPAIIHATKQIVQTVVPLWHQPGWHQPEPINRQVTLPMELLPVVQQRRWDYILTKN